MMLIIRDSQIVAFRKHSTKQFVMEINHFLRRRFQEKNNGRSDEELNSFIEKQIERAASYGLSERSCLRTYIEIASLYGKYFDVEKKWAWNILNRKSLRERDKANWLMEYAIFVEERDGKF